MSGHRQIFLGLFRPVTIIGNLRKEAIISHACGVAIRRVIRQWLIRQFPDNIQVRPGRRAGVSNFPQAQMLQYLLNNGLLFNKTDDFHLPLTLGA